MPLLGGLVIDEGSQVGQHPVVALFVDDDVIGLAGFATVFDHVSILPFHLARSRVHANKLTVA